MPLILLSIKVFSFDSRNAGFRPPLSASKQGEPVYCSQLSFFVACLPVCLRDSCHKLQWPESSSCSSLKKTDERRQSAGEMKKDRPDKV